MFCALELLSVSPHPVPNRTARTTPGSEVSRKNAPPPLPPPVTGGAAERRLDLRLLALPAGSRSRFRLLWGSELRLPSAPGKTAAGSRGCCRNS